ncbi:MAG: CotH kinase family protein [Alistipes sp.]|nr:CotH kinase family protein [Alistipes sp.]
MRKHLLYALLCMTTLWCGCKDDKNSEPTPEPEEPAIELGFTSFKFEASKNPLYLYEDVEATIKNGEISAVIPYVVDVNKLVPTFEGGFVKVYVGTKVQQSGVTVNDFTKELTYTLSAGTVPDRTVQYKASVFCFTGLPIVTVETENRSAITSKDTYVKGTVTISKTANYESGYTGTMKIRGRGNATWGYAKKPYRIKLDAKSAVLGMPADKDWVLLANYCDKSLLRTATAFKLSELLSMPWTPRSRFVEYFLNGRYQGNYQLTEHVKVAADRMNVSTDGYLIERDGYYNLEPKWFVTDLKGHPFTFKYPDTDDLTQAQLDYIKGYMDAFEKALYSDDFKNASTGYRKYIDPEVWANWYLVNEVLCNKDTNFYFYKKDSGSSKLGMSPVWDFEWSLGVGWNYTEPARYDVLVQRWLYFDRLMQDPYFVGLVKKRWETVKNEYIPQLYDFINAKAREISLSQKTNFEKWNILNTPVSVEVITLGTWANEVQYVKDFLAKRVEWLSTEIPKW